MNFLGAHEWYYGEEKITLTEISEITKVYYNAEDPDYKKILKYYLLGIYKEFKNVFLGNKLIPYTRSEIITTKLN